MSVIEHSRACDDQLLGYIARHYPSATFTLRNLQDGAAAVRSGRLAPYCDCGRFNLVQLKDAIDHTRLKGDPDDRLAEMLRRRIALREELHEREEQSRELQRAENEMLARKRQALDELRALEDQDSG